MAGNSFTQIHDTSNTHTWSYFYPQIPACKGREKIVYIHANQHKHHGSWERSPQRAISKVTSITAVCDYRVSVGSPDRPGDRAGVGPHAPAHHTHTRPPITSWRRAPHHHPTCEKLTARYFSCHFYTATFLNVWIFQLYARSKCLPLLRAEWRVYTACDLISIFSLYIFLYITLNVAHVWKTSSHLAEEHRMWYSIWYDLWSGSYKRM